MQKIARSLPMALVALLGGAAACASDDVSGVVSEDLTEIQRRLALLEARLPDLAKKAAARFAAETETPPLDRLLEIGRCSGGSDTAGQRFVSLGDCDFDFRNGASSITTLRGTVTGFVTLRGEPDLDSPQDPESGQAPPPATHDKVSRARVSNLRIVAGPAPAVAPPIALADEVSLRALAIRLVGHQEPEELEIVSAEFGACPEVSNPDSETFVALPAGARRYCATYFAESDLTHGEVELGFAVQNDRVIGIVWVGHASHL